MAIFGATQIPDALLPDAVDAFCDRGGKVGGTNAERRAFANDQVRDYIHSVIRQWRVDQSVRVERERATKAIDDQLLASS